MVPLNLLPKSNRHHESISIDRSDDIMEQTGSPVSEMSPISRWFSFEEESEKFSDLRLKSPLLKCRELTTALAARI